MSRSRRHHHHPHQLGFRRHPRIADLMTPELTAFVERGSAAERVGDLDAALLYHSSIPMFRRSRHRAILEQLCAARSDLTPWVWVRWMVYLAIRCEDRGSRTGRLVRSAMTEAVETFHPDLMQRAFDEGGDPVKVSATVMGESWACHQLTAHGYGALAAFLDEHAGGELARHAELARSWIGARMSGYRIEGSAAGTLRVRDLADRRVVDVLDLGAARLAGADGTLVGRLVPSGTTPGLMFDTVPLPLPEPVATDVACTSAAAGWVDVLADAIVHGRLDPGRLLREDYQLVSDIPSLDLLAFGTRPGDLPRVTAQLHEGRDEIGRAAFRILRLAAVGTLEDDAAPYVGAACLNARAHASAQQRILAPGQQTRWLRWAELVPAPARTRLLGFAETTVDAA